jgi:hypothetical protein
LQLIHPIANRSLGVGHRIDMVRRATKVLNEVSQP